MVLKTFISLNKYTPNNRMDCSELLRLRLANTLYCRQQNTCGNETPVQTPVQKSFTIFLDYSTGTSGKVISSVYIPPGLYGSNADASLVLGGTFTDNVGTDLIFKDNITIDLQNTTYAFVCAIAASGSIPDASGPRWQPVSSAYMGPPGGIKYSITSPNNITILGLELGKLNGDNITSRATSGPGAGFLASITLFYL